MFKYISFFLLMLVSWLLLTSVSSFYNKGLQEIIAIAFISTIIYWFLDIVLFSKSKKNNK